ncbi:TraR/DksA C4-type zinc finger protein [Candidatus Kaiserbacteria bacterium]|nr:TraR/DksA C4-type zinc finger protein [Candidatus Kaiserbacteria bacterium]
MKDTVQYKTRLEEELKELTAELKTIGVHDPENTENWIESGADLNDPSADPLDVADRTEEYGERRATVAVLETRYNNITRALEKIEKGTYGICEISGEEISPERLDANPAARTCTAHMEEENSLS